MDVVAIVRAHSTGSQLTRAAPVIVGARVSCLRGVSSRSWGTTSQFWQNPPRGKKKFLSQDGRNQQIQTLHIPKFALGQCLASRGTQVDLPRFCWVRAVL